MVIVCHFLRSQSLYLSMVTLCLIYIEIGLFYIYCIIRTFECENMNVDEYQIYSAANALNRMIS